MYHSPNIVTNTPNTAPIKVTALSTPTTEPASGPHNILMDNEEQ